MAKYIYIISVVLAALCLSSCQQAEDAPEGVQERFRIKAYVGDPVLSRTTPRPDDGFSVNAFTNGDEAGFFSQSGDKNHSNRGFENSWMEFKNGYFVGADDMSVDINRLGKTLLYYPYSSGTGGRQPVRNDNGEVNDVLIALSVGNPEDQQSALVARFSHLFSMLVIEGGYGFKDFWKEDEESGKSVSVTLSKAVETVEFMRVDNSDVGYWVRLNGGHIDAGTTPDPSLAEVKGHYNETTNRYYVIIPTDGGIRVESINVYDDAGNPHKIKWNKLVDMGKRYPLTLELNELIPTIYLHDITPWDTGIELGANESRGIDNASELKAWYEVYNQDNPKDEDLLQYGDKVQVIDADGNPTSEAYWRFYLTADIDMSGYSDDESAHLVNTLKDEFDGCGYTIKGLSYKGKTNAALFNVIDGKYACVKNLVVDNLLIETTGSEPVGALVTDFKSGVIADCSFTDLSIHTHYTAVGALAGKITGRDKDIIVRNCKFSGAIFGTTTVDKIAGDGQVSEVIKKGCDVSNVMFGEIRE